MKKANLTRVRDRALVQLRQVEARLRVADRGRGIPREFAQWAYSMLAASAWTLWERFAEDVIIVQLNRDSNALSDALDLSLPRHMAVDTVRAILLARGYFDFANSSDLIRKANRYLGKPRNPFHNVTSGDREILDDLAVVRNAILHGSAEARRRYVRLLRHRHHYTNTVTPGIFLRGGPAGATRLDTYLHALNRAIRQVVP